MHKQVWYIGPIGALAGTEFGADLGFEVCLPYDPVPWGDTDVSIFVSLQLCLQRSHTRHFGGWKFVIRADKTVATLHLTRNLLSKAGYGSVYLGSCIYQFYFHIVNLGLTHACFDIKIPKSNCSDNLRFE